MTTLAGALFLESARGARSKHEQLAVTCRLFVALAPQSVWSQRWPTKSVRIVVPYAPGANANFDRFIRNEIAKYTKVIQAAGIKADFMIEPLIL
jgi:tripartite-type tricarboxylate transporter receptor subunit TctC